MCLFGFPACHDTPQRASIAFHLESTSPPLRFLRHASRSMLHLSLKGHFAYLRLLILIFSPPGLRVVCCFNSVLVIFFIQPLPCIFSLIFPTTNNL